MRRGLTASGSLVWLVTLSASARAQSTVPSEHPSPASRQAPSPSIEPSREVRRDPRGIKGISPFGEAIQRGDRALLARDFDTALASYRDALEKEPQNALGYYRVAEAQILKGELKEAETAIAAGLHVLSASNPSLKAKLQFALADVRERQKAYDEASAAWVEYETLTTAHEDAAGLKATAAARIKVVTAWKKLAAEAAEVKARIEKGMQAADEAVRKSSK